MSRPLATFVGGRPQRHARTLVVQVIHLAPTIPNGDDRRMNPQTATPETSVMHERYARAEALSGQNAMRLVERSEAVARFLPGSDRFRLVESLPERARVQLVDPDAGTIEEAEPEREALGEGWAVSPDERWAARLAEGNLVVLDRDSGEERQVTHDGTSVSPYASRLDFWRLEGEMRGFVLPPVVEWSPDGTRLLMERIDQSQVGESHLLRVVEDEPRAQLLTYRDALAGDEHLPTSQLFVVELESGVVTPAQMEPAPVACLALLHPFRWGWFSPDGARVEAVVHSRDHREMRLLSIDARTGESRIAATQRGATVQDPALFIMEERPPARVLSDGRALWMTERDGWGHLWLVDGDEWQQVTRGEWVVRQLLHVDEERGELLISANGREPDEGKLERRLYRVPLEGGEPELLTPEPLDHAMWVSPSGRWVVDCMAGPADPSVTVLRDASDGSIVRELTRADATKLFETGWRPPQRFTVTAADGETELYGVLMLPTDFDETKRYPLMDMVYPGPQMGVVPRRFWTSVYLSRAAAYTALGVVAMLLDARGTPGRSKAFHDGPLETTQGIADHAAAVRQLAERHSWIDATRVGMSGGSGGGSMTVRALIEQPETFTVGISAVGNHDNRRYHAAWGERYMGLMEDDPEAWERQSNVARAARLRGHLLLIYAEMDPNVHPVNTRALIAALVEADVDHDVVVIPDGGHLAVLRRYPVRRTWDYVTRHLLGEEPPAYTMSLSSEPRERPEYIVV